MTLAEQAILDVQGGRITFTEFEEMFGITEYMNECHSHYGMEPRAGCRGCERQELEEPDYEKSHRNANKAMAWLNKHLAKRKTSQ